jgi:DNA-binding transcriptional regulator YiaG
MSVRGTPLPWKLREEIKHLRNDERLTVRETARRAGVSTDTVLKYGRQPPAKLTR